MVICNIPLLFFKIGVLGYLFKEKEPSSNVFIVVNVIANYANKK
jgi:hypothetical protein